MLFELDCWLKFVGCLANGFVSSVEACMVLSREAICSCHLPLLVQFSVLLDRVLRWASELMLLFPWPGHIVPNSRFV